MFPESSTWRADVVRVTAHGRRVPVEIPWAGYRWDQLVTERGLSSPSFRRHADAGLDNQLAFLRAALDWVAANTPRDHTTRYLEARVTAWHNDDPPRLEIFRSGPRGTPSRDRAGGHRAAPGGGPPRASGRAARPRGEPARPLAAARAGRPDRGPPPRAVPVRLAPRPHLPGRLPRALCLVVSGAAGRRLHRRPLDRRGCRGGDVARSARASVRAHADRHRHDVRGCGLQPLPLHHPLPQQPRVPGDRARHPRHGPRGAGGSPPPPAGSPPRGRCGCSGSSAPRSTGRPGSASWSIRIGSEGRSHGSASSKHATTSTRSPTGLCRSSPTGTSIPERPRRSS